MKSNSRYIKNQYFYLQDPSLVYETYSEEDVITENLPPNWADNAIKLVLEGLWLYDQDFFPSTVDPTTLRVFVDDNIPDNNQNTIAGKEIDHPETTYEFDEFELGRDYDFVDNNWNLIVFYRNINPMHVVGITFTTIDGQQVGDPNGNPIEVKLLKRADQNPIDDPDTWILTARNVYEYGMSTGLGLNLKIGHKDEPQDVLNLSVPDSIDIGSFDSFIELFHLDVNGDDVANSEDNIFIDFHPVVILPFIYPFKDIEPVDIYFNEYYGDCNYYVRIEREY